MQNLPRVIDPSLVDVGDTITVTYPKDAGVLVHMVGKVARIRDEGNYKHFDTKEGGRIFHWRAGDRSGIRVTLTARDPQPQIPMFDSETFDQVRERIK